jgi:hypothetical protein
MKLTTTTNVSVDGLMRGCDGPERTEWRIRAPRMVHAAA